jgi:hypothetical protein
VYAILEESGVPNEVAYARACQAANRWPKAQNADNAARDLKAADKRKVRGRSNGSV